MEDMLIVTNWDKVDPSDFYLTKVWFNAQGIEKAERAKLRRMAKDGELFEAFEVPAVSYALYVQMDAHQIFIDHEGNHMLSCESAVIDRDHQDKWEMEY